MWMVYKSFPDVSYFKSTLNYFIELFTDLKCYVDHEANYNMDQHELNAKYWKPKPAVFETRERTN